MVKLLEVTKENYDACLALTVADSQRSFIASNLYTMAQAYIYRDVVRLYAICAEGRPVGLTMLDVDHKKKDYWIWRFMIDKDFQHRGYGTAALELLLDYFTAVGAKEVKLSFEKENLAAESLYRACGFQRTGGLHDGEIVMAADLRGRGAPDTQVLTLL